MEATAMKSGAGLAVVNGPGAVVRAYEWEMTAEQEQLIRDTFFPGAKEAEIRPLIEISRVRRLNPFTKQIHFVKRWNTQLQREVWAAQVGIDGFRAIAERTGKYAGQDEPEYEYDKNGKLLKCRVRVYRKDWERPAVGVAFYREYVQMTKDKKTGEERPNAMWGRGEHFMLAKCAEAVGLRKAFPEDLSGLYEPSELGGETEERELNAVPRSSAKELARAKVEAISKPTSGLVVDVHDGETEEQAAARHEEAPPHDPETGEVKDDRLKVPFGKNAGQPIGGLSDKQLAWYYERASEKLAQGDERDRAWFEALEAEKAERALRV